MQIIIIISIINVLASKSKTFS